MRIKFLSSRCYALLALIFMIYNVHFTSSQTTAASGKVKKHKQEIKQRSSNKKVENDASANKKETSKLLSNDLDDLNEDYDPRPPLSDANNEDNLDEEIQCPPCTKASSNGKPIHLLKAALQTFWQGDYLSSYGCACNYLTQKPTDSIGKSLLYSMKNVPGIDFKTHMLATNEALQDPKSIVKEWEILGPINVGKLELDADPTFNLPDELSKSNWDVASCILSLADNYTVFTDLLTEGKLSWRKINTKANSNQVDINFNVQWNEIAQALSSVAVYEIQGWMRAVTYIKTPGSYVIDCQGAHTVYIRNDFMTRTLAADVYRAQKIRSSVDLKPGLVGIVIPLRTVVQAQVAFSIEPAPNVIIAYSPTMVPNLLELQSNRGYGLLFSSVFILPIQNVFSHSITLEFSVEKPIGEEGSYLIREAKRKDDNSYIITHSMISPGQTLGLPLELVYTSTDSKLPYISCRENRVFKIIITPSRGQSIEVPLEFQCRRWDQSFLYSFLSHDSSVTQAAAVLPLDYHSPKHKAGTNRQTNRKNTAKAATAATAATTTGAVSNNSNEACLLADANGQCESGFEVSYPALLTLHGSGIAPQSHADSYKMMPLSSKDYVFGVEGFYTVSPTRFGAHNWEGVGDLSARSAVAELQYLIKQTQGKLPALTLDDGIISGHSMGGHGAWVTATNAPNRFVCALPASGWIKKEEYSSSNSFFSLDVGTSYVDPAMKVILEKSLSEYHIDHFASNLRAMDVHIRVGSHDTTTHTWFSRRMHRVLLHYGVNSTIEEVMGKQHWWWDSLRENDGGVVNDLKMRSFYSDCHKRFLHQQRLKSKFEEYKRSAVRDRFHAWMVNASVSAALAAVPVVPGLPKTLDSNAMQSLMDEIPEHRCAVNFTLSLNNPALHEGLCGIQVLQQFQTLMPSKVSINCSSNASNNKIRLKSCSLTASNVKRLLVSTAFSSAIFQADEVFVNGVKLAIDYLQPVGGDYHVCLSMRGRDVSICSTALNPLSEKTLVSYGPIRRVYDRPLFIVYGTPPSQQLRLAMRDLAVYLGNSHYTSHSSFVQVVSDLEFRSGNYARQGIVPNIIFIGDTATNKLLRAVLDVGGSSNANSKGNSIPIKGKLPDTVEFFYEEETDGVDESFLFKLAGYSFSQKDDAIAFTMPLYRDPSFLKGSTGTSSSSESSIEVHSSHLIPGAAMAVCIHANSALGFTHFSRLAWSVIPPMVRAPFSNYMPDYVVSNRRLWELGAGGIQIAGYWDSDWRFDREQAFVSGELL